MNYVSIFKKSGIELGLKNGSSVYIQKKNKGEKQNSGTKRKYKMLDKILTIPVNSLNAMD